jgi:hypothetical protein
VSFSYLLLLEKLFSNIEKFNFESIPTFEGNGGNSRRGFSSFFFGGLKENTFLTLLKVGGGGSGGGRGFLALDGRYSLKHFFVFRAETWGERKWFPS